MKYADKFWQDAVMAEMRHADSGNLALPSSKSDLYSSVGKDIKLPAFARQDCIDRALRQLKAAGKIVFYYDWQGWQIPNFDSQYDEQREEQYRQQDAAHKARMDKIDAEHEARMARYASFDVKPKKGRFTDLAEKLEAKANATEFPGEAAAFRAKAAEYRERGD